MAFDLGALLQNVPDLNTGREQIEYIALGKIQEDPNNFYQLSGIEELAANIQLCGLQQPIRVRPKGDGYVIVSGHRRRKALEMLAEEEPQRWQEVACIVEADEVSPALQQLRLIYANANTRSMTAAEISEQAEQVQNLLYQLKEEGYSFPGRMRDYVAEAVGVSKSKLARLKVIRDDLSAVWQPAWKDGTLSENTAYELAKLDKAYQMTLFEEKTRTNANLSYLYADDVKRYGERVEAISKLPCQESGGICCNQDAKHRKAAVSDRYGWFHCDKKCCKDCPELDRCQRACPKLKDLIQKHKAEAKQVAKAAAEAKAKQEAPAVAQMTALWQRFGLARDEADKSIEECKKAMGMYYFPFDEEKAMKLERLETKIEAGGKLPFGPSFYLTDANQLIALADLLGCSLDYLFCRTDVKELTSEKVPKSDTMWHPMTEEPPIGVDLVWLSYDGYVDTGKYYGGQKISIACTIEYDEARYWAYKPEDL